MSSESNNTKNPAGKENTVVSSLPTGPINECEVDITHFCTPKEILGIGGFGIVKKVVKLTCEDAKVCYAMKSMSKATILARPSGTMSVLTELNAMILVRECENVCKIHYAFQDDSFLYTILEYAVGGDMRFNLRNATNNRFSESLSKMFIRQVFTALEYCHNCSILHRGIFYQYIYQVNI
jgi:serine/threonine protein kinase